MLACYLEWHMRACLAPLLVDDHDRADAAAQRVSPVARVPPVAKAKPSPAARRKARRKLTGDGLPVHSFRSLLADLATSTRNTVRFGRGTAMELPARPTPRSSMPSPGASTTSSSTSSTTRPQRAASYTGAQSADRFENKAVFAARIPSANASVCSRPRAT
jgi:hypothetical protein